MKKLYVVICLLSFVVFVGQVGAWQDTFWTVVDGTEDKHSDYTYCSIPQTAQPPSIHGFSIVGVYKNNGNPLMEIKVCDHDFSIIYNTTDMTIWGMIFPGAVPGSDALGGSCKSNDITILRKGITKAKNCFSKYCDFDKIHIQHIEDEETGWCPFQINLLYNCGNKENRFLCSGVYWGIINFRGPPNFFDPKTYHIYMKRFRCEKKTGFKTWSEKTSVSLLRNTMKISSHISYTIDINNFSLWRKEARGGKDATRCNIIIKDGTPEDHKEPGTAILIYEGNDTVVYKFSSQD